MTAVIEERIKATEGWTLRKGDHEPNDEGKLCIMEAVAYVAGEPWSDHPECASPLLTSFMVRLNDRLDDERRQELKPYIERLVNTRDGQDAARRWLIVDWATRTALPAWLEVSGQQETADKLRALPAITPSVHADHAEWLRQIRDEAWDRRTGWRKKVREAVGAEFERRGVKFAAADTVAVTAADAAAVAAAVAAADAAAAAAADAVTVAVTAADAVHDTVAVAVAAADAVTVADAAAAAVAAAAAAAPWDKNYDAVYTAVKAKVKPQIEQSLKSTTDALWPTTLDLIDRLIDPSQPKGSNA